VSTVPGVFHDLSEQANAQIQAAYNLPFRLVDDPLDRAAEAFGLRR
jgi:hypothetical protein